MKKSNRIEGDRLTARPSKQARRHRTAVNAPSKEEREILRAIREGKAVVVQLPPEDTGAGSALNIVLRLYPGLTAQAVAQFLVDDDLNQGHNDLGLLDTYGYWAHEAMTKYAKGEEARA